GGGERVVARSRAAAAVSTIAGTVSAHALRGRERVVPRSGAGLSGRPRRRRLLSGGSGLVGGCRTRGGGGPLARLGCWLLRTRLGHRGSCWGTGGRRRGGRLGRTRLGAGRAGRRLRRAAGLVRAGCCLGAGAPGRRRGGLLRRAVLGGAALFGSLLRGCLLGGGRRILLDLADHGRLDGRRCRPDELSLFLQVGAQLRALAPGLLRQLIDPNRSHRSPSVGGSVQPL